MSATSNVKRIHWLSAITGVLILVFGLLVMVQPSLAQAVPLTDTLIGPVAVLTIMLGLWEARIRYNEGVDHLEFPTPELPFALPTPGDELDEMLYRYTHRSEGTIDYPERIGERLREVAIAAIAHRESCTRDEAVQQLEDGTWTENQYAKAFFSEEFAVPEPSFGERVERSLGRSESRYERQIRETVDAIVAIAELVDDSEDLLAQTDDSDGVLESILGDDDDEDEQRSVDPNERSITEYSDGSGTLVTEGVHYRDTVWTGRWNGIGAFALLAVGIGVIAVRPGLVLASSVAVAYAAYARSGGDPSPATLSVDRHVDENNPAPGDRIEVTVTVENEGETFLPDLRLVDLVPANMRVVEGSPRLYTSLRPGATSRFTYVTVAERGEHEWPLLAVGSGFAASVEREAVIDVDQTVTCVPRLQTVNEIPVRAQTTVYAGQVETDRGGSGLEFHSVRDYRPNDPMRRVDWNRRARTGELATIDFREEQAATVVLLFDAREGAYVSEGPGKRHALDRSVDAASEIYTALADSGDLVGIAAFDTVPCWLSPSAGDGHDEAARLLFAHHPALKSLLPDMLDLEGGYVDPMTHVRRQLPASTQVMLFSPLTSDYPAEVARRLDSAGHRVTIVSPDPTADRTSGQRLSRVERALRLNGLRERGVRVIDWKPDESPGLSIQRASRRWMA